MPKGRGEQAHRETERLETEPGSHRRLRAAVATGSKRTEPFVLAFADALRDILHDELRPTG